ncbi:MAG TPA: carboxymuconolactone decarboxylase family protein [Candidatus Dormibacteraeota bacterium]|jgi:AhpD family alkylhydroperoxidase|nr:carboxymuconolactone decarboxylase family protein [Candidatus Dormibacteraeota bacterium]
MTPDNRIRLLERDQVTPEIAAVYDALLAARGVVPNMFKALAHTPAIAQAVAGFLKPLLADGALKGWYKELVAIRVSQRNASEYAIRAHSISARQKGATEEQITAVGDCENGPFSPKEKIGFRLADKLHLGGSAVDDSFFAEMSTIYSEPEIVELFLTAAAFEMFPRFIDGLHIPVTPPPAAK